MKKVLLILELADFGGLSRSNINMALALRNRYKVSVFHGYNFEQEKQSLISNWKNLVEKIYFYKFFPLKSTIITNVINIFWFYKGLNSFLKNNSFDIVVTNLPSSTISAGFLKKKFKYKLYSFFHGNLKDEKLSFHNYANSNFNWFTRKKILISAIFQFSLQRVSHKMVNSTFVCSNYARFIAGDKLKINPELVFLPVLVPNLIKKKVKTRHLSVALSSRIEPRKGVSVFIEAAEILLRKNANIDFHIFGRVYNEQYYLKLLNQFPSMKISWHGAVSHDQLLVFYENIDLLVTPSIVGETLGFSTLEALGMGIPVVGSRSGATPEILESIDRRLIFANYSATDLAKKITWFKSLSNHERSIIAYKSVAYVKKVYSQKQFLNFFDQLNNKNRGS